MGTFTFEANRARVFVNDVEFILLQNVRGSDDYAPEPVSGIGDIHVREYPPTIARHQFTLSGYMVKDEPAIANGIFSENGASRLDQDEFTVEIFDKDGPLLRKYIGVSFANGSFNMTAHRLMMKDATFNARDVEGTFR